MKDFNQVYVSDVLPHFKEGFINKWGLEEYRNTNEPSIFLGLYSQKDLDTFINHKSYKIITLAGNDMRLPQFNLLKNTVDFKQVFCWQAPGTPSDLLSNNGIPHKSIYVAMKSYDEFLPTLLGENIYVYKGLHGNRPDYFQWNQIIEPLKEVFGEDRIIYTEFKTSIELIENYYNNCFTYVKPNELGGATSMWELAHMGRRTLGSGFPNLSYTTSYKDIYHLIDLIQEEAKYIGTVRNDVANEAQKTFIGEEWLSLNYWI